jgi:uncharacterized lipoprotein YajG
MKQIMITTAAAAFMLVGCDEGKQATQIAENTQADLAYQGAVLRGQYQAALLSGDRNAQAALRYTNEAAMMLAPWVR